MAKLSSSTVLLLVSAIVVAVAGGAPPAGVQEKVKAACDSTPHPVTCDMVLSPSANASNAADECTLALLASKQASDLLFEASKKVSTLAGKIKDNGKGLDKTDLPEYAPCLTQCSLKLFTGFVTLSGTVRRDAFTNPDKKVTIADVRKFVEASKKEHLVWSCDVCRSEGNKKVEEVAAGSRLDKFMQVLNVLVDRVPAGKEC